MATKSTPPRGGSGAHAPTSARTTRATTAWEDDDLGSKTTMWGFLAGVITAAFIAIPLSASFAFATNPQTQQLFAGRLSDATRGGYMAFWWLATLLFLALPFVVGFGVATLRGKALGIIGAVLGLVIIAMLVLGQIYVF